MRYGDLNSFFKNSKVKRFFKRLQQKRKIIFLILVLILILLISAFLIFFTSPDTVQVKNSSTKLANPNALKLLKKNEVTLWINQGGPYDRDFYFHKNEKIIITLDITKETQDSLLPLADELINKDLISIQVEGANEIKEFKIVKGTHGKVDYTKEDGKLGHGQSIQLTTSYIAKKAGKDTVKIAIKGTNIKYESHLFILDPSYFSIPIGLNSENVSFITPNSLSVRSKVKNVPGQAGDSRWWWNIDYPGNIEYDFTSNGKKFDYAYLAVFAIADKALEKYDPKSSLNNFPYMKNLQELTKVISQKPTIPSDSSGIIAFPPINAGPGPRSHMGFLDFQNGTGVRYLIAGWYQAYDPSDFPSYTYQGITADGKYQVFFRYSKLYSSQLDNYLLQHKDNYNLNEEKLDKYINGSFASVKTEENFSPSISELDEFVKSIRIEK